MNIISQYWSDDKTREAIICNDDGFVVALYENNKLLETRDVRMHSLRYAEDLAENFVMKWGEWSEGKTS